MVDDIQTSEDRFTGLLGLVAYAEMCTCENLARATADAPTFADRLALLEVAAMRVDQHRALRHCLADLGADPIAAMEPYRRAVDEYHHHTVPQSWPEALVKGYVGDGLALDLRAEVAGAAGVAMVSDLLGTQAAERGLIEFAQARIVSIVAQQPELSGRLALWARRLAGEAMTQAQRLASADARWGAMLTGTSADATGDDLPAVNELFARMLAAHQERLSAVGLR